MKKNILLSLVFIFAAANSLTGFAKPMVLIEEAIESESLVIKMSKDLTGVIRGRICDRCELIVVRITPETKLFINGKQTDLSKASGRSGKPGTASFNVKSQKVTKIYSYE